MSLDYLSQLTLLQLPTAGRMLMVGVLEKSSLLAEMAKKRMVPFAILTAKMATTGSALFAGRDVLQDLLTLEVTVSNLQLMEEVLDTLFGITISANMKTLRVVKNGVLFGTLNVEKASTILDAVFAHPTALNTPSISVSCQKDSYGRGWGEVLTCEKGLEMSGALCYPPCKYGYHGNGPVCWENCPVGKHTCGALCTDSADACTESIKSIVSNVFGMAEVIAIGVAGGHIDVP